MRTYFLLVLLIVCSLMISCASTQKIVVNSQEMLARSQTITSDEKWIDLKTVEDAFERIVPGTTTTDDLVNIGFSRNDKNVTWLNYHELRKRFVGDIRPSDSFTILERELLECVDVGRDCHGRIILIKQTRTTGQESFVSGALLRNEINETVGWSFEGTIAIKNGVVVYAYPDKVTGSSYQYLEQRNPGRAVSGFLPF